MNQNCAEVLSVFAKTAQIHARNFHVAHVAHVRVRQAHLFRKNYYFVIFIYLQNPGKTPVKERCAEVWYGLPELSAFIFFSLFNFRTVILVNG